MSEYTARFSTPRWIERGKSNTLDLPVYKDGQIQTPSSGTFTLYNPEGNAVVDALAVTIVDGVATYAVTSAVLNTSTTLGYGWFEVWNLTLAGTAVEFQRDAYLCVRRIKPCVTDQDLIRVRQSLSELLFKGHLNTFQPYIDDALDYILNRLLNDGHDPSQIRSPSSLYYPLLYKSLASVFEDASTYMEGSGHHKTAEDYRKRFEEEYGRMQFSKDTSGDGLPQKSETGKASQPVIQLGGAPSSWSYLRRYR